MKKALIVAFMLCLATAGFSQQLLTSLRNGTLLTNKQEVSFDKEQTYFYLIKNTDLQIYQTKGVFYVADYFEQNSYNGNEPEDDYEGAIAFTFEPVNTQEGIAIKIQPEILNWDGITLKGSTLTVTEDETGLKVSFTMKRRVSKKEGTKVFEVLVPAEKPALTAQQLSAMAAKNIRLALAAK